MSFSTIPIKTTIPTPGTTPAAASAFIVSSIDEVNTLEITGDCSAGSGSLILVRYFADLDEWRPWHEDRPLTVDSAVRDGLFSGVYPIPKGDEAFVLYDSAAAITATVKARRTSSPDEATAAPASAALPSGAATSAKQDTSNTALAAILGQLDSKTSVIATQTTAAAMLAQLDSKTSTLATGAKQDAAKTVLDTLATQTTAAAILAQLDAKTSTLLTDAQLRATALPVSGTTTANQGTGAGAAAPWSVELSDGAAFYTGAKTGQFPTTLGQTTKAGSLSVTLPSDIAGTTPTTSTKTASSAVALFASNTSAKKRVISNLPSSNGVLYVLYGSDTPTNDGANCSFSIQPGQSWEEQVINGELCYNGAIQGILATGSTVQVCEIQ